MATPKEILERVRAAKAAAMAAAAPIPEVKVENTPVESIPVPVPAVDTTPTVSTGATAPVTTVLSIEIPVKSEIPATPKVKKERAPFKKGIDENAPSNFIAKCVIKNPALVAKEAREILNKEGMHLSDAALNFQISSVRTILKLIQLLKDRKEI